MCCLVWLPLAVFITRSWIDCDSSLNRFILFAVCIVRSITLKVLKKLIDLHSSLLFVLLIFHPYHVIRQTHFLKTLKVSIR